MLRNIVIAVILLAGIYFIFFQSQPTQVNFDQGKNRIDAFWDSESLDPYSLTEQDKATVSLSSLSNVERNLESYKTILESETRTQDTAALIDLIDIHLALIEEIELRQEMLSLAEVVGKYGVDEICDNLNDYVTLNSRFGDLEDKVVSKNINLASFLTTYTGKDPSGEILLLSEDQSSLRDRVSESNEGLSNLQELC
tara:strand:+ start:1413 stop:2003 length:591 start_codon:yes stop_codon:yes gene_type:complete